MSYTYASTRTDTAHQALVVYARDERKDTIADAVQCGWAPDWGVSPEQDFSSEDIERAFDEVVEKILKLDLKYQEE